MKWMSKPIYAFDTETTGTNPKTDRIIQIAILKFEPGRRWEQMEAWTLVGDPGVYIPPDATLIHGFTSEALKGKPPVESKAKLIHQIISEGEVFLAYNAEFDISFLTEMMKRAGVTKPLPCNQKNTIDPLFFSRGLYPSVRGHKLGQVAPRFGVQLRQAHNALADTQAAAEVMIKMAIQHALPEELEALMVLQHQYQAEWKASRRY